MEDFIDPENNENLDFESTLSFLWKIVIPNTKLSEIIKEYPSIEHLILEGRNNSFGCWIVFTSEKIADKIHKHLLTKFSNIDYYMCNIKGNKTTIFEVLDKIEIKKWRPWNTDLEKSTEPYLSEEFFYCIIDYDRNLDVYFVPENHWNKTKQLFDGSLGIEDRLEKCLKPSNDPYRFTAYGDLMSLKQNLDKMGFRYTVLFEMYINDL